MCSWSLYLNRKIDTVFLFIRNRYFDVFILSNNFIRQNYICTIFLKCSQYTKGYLELIHQFIGNMIKNFNQRIYNFCILIQIVGGKLEKNLPTIITVLYIFLPISFKHYQQSAFELHAFFLEVITTVLISSFACF